MPEIKCHAGHTMSIGTDEWVSTLTLAQMRYARDKMDEKIKEAEEQPRRYVWRVCDGGIVAENYREEDYASAAEHLMRIFRDRFIEEAREFVAKPYGIRTLLDDIPHIDIVRVTQFEYENEWFPEKP